MVITELISKLEELKSKYGNIEISNLEGVRATEVHYVNYENVVDNYNYYPKESIRIA